MAVWEKMVNEGVGATKAVFGVNKANRGGTFKVTDAKPYVDAVNKMTVGEGQSKEVIDLHVKSVNAHYDVMTSLTDTMRPEDDPFVEHYQTPPILEIMYEEDPAFKASMWKFIDAIAANKALIGRESVRRYGGMYGPTCVVDFAMSVGSVPNVVNQILTRHGHPQGPQAHHPGLQVLGHEHLVRPGRRLPRRAGVGQDGGRGRAGRGRHDAVHLPRAFRRPDAAHGHPQPGRARPAHLLRHAQVHGAATRRR